MLELAAAAIVVPLAILVAHPGVLRLSILLIAAGPAASAAGWAISPTAHSPIMQLTATVALLLPVAVIALGLALRSFPKNLAETTAACGASPLQTLIHAWIRPALPALAATFALTFILALGITPMLAPLAARP
jgi:ABC-type Fe3+ transport system permease subunit